MKGMDMGKKPVAGAKQQTHTASGIVRKTDVKAGKVTVEQGPVASLNWPTMTMAFKVKDKALWKQLEGGRKGRRRVREAGQGLRRDSGQMTGLLRN